MIVVTSGRRIRRIGRAVMKASGGGRICRIVESKVSRIHGGHRGRIRRLEVACRVSTRRCLIVGDEGTGRSGYGCHCSSRHLRCRPAMTTLIVRRQRRSRSGRRRVEALRISRRIIWRWGRRRWRGGRGRSGVAGGVLTRLLLRVFRLEIRVRIDGKVAVGKVGRLVAVERCGGLRQRLTSLALVAIVTRLLMLLLVLMMVMLRLLLLEILRLT